MPGRPEFSQPGTEGGGQTVAVQQRPEIGFQELSQSSTLASGTDELVEVYAPEGMVYNLRFLQFRVGENTGAGATSGNHLITPREDTLAFLRGKSSHDQSLEFSRNQWTSANSEKQPTGAAAVQAIQVARATATEPIVLRYKNGTDAEQPNSRDWTIQYDEVSY